MSETAGLRDRVLQAIVTADVSSFVSGIEISRQALIAFGTRVTGMSSQLTTMGLSMRRMGAIMSLAISTPLSLLARQSVMASIAAEEMQNRFRVAFSDIQSQAMGVTRAFADAFDINLNSAMSSFSRIGDMLVGFGLSQDKALQTTERIMRYAGDLTSFYNHPGGIEGMAELILKAGMGRPGGLAMRGGVMTFNQFVKDDRDALVAGGMSLLEARMEAALIQIPKQAINAMGDYERTQHSMANRIRHMKQLTQEMSLGFGRMLIEGLNLEPVLSQLAESFKSLVNVMEYLADKGAQTVARMVIALIAAGPLLGFASVALLAFAGLLKFLGGAFFLATMKFGLAGVLLGSALLNLSRGTGDFATEAESTGSLLDDKLIPAMHTFGTVLLSLVEASEIVSDAMTHLFIKMGEGASNYLSRLWAWAGDIGTRHVAGVAETAGWDQQAGVTAQMLRDLPQAEFEKLFKDAAIQVWQGQQSEEDAGHIFQRTQGTHHDNLLDQLAKQVTGRLSTRSASMDDTKWFEEGTQPEYYAQRTYAELFEQRREAQLARREGIGMDSGLEGFRQHLNDMFNYVRDLDGVPKDTRLPSAEDIASMLGLGEDEAMDTKLAGAAEWGSREAYTIVARSFANRNRVDDKIENNTKRTADNTERMIDLMDSGVDTEDVVDF